MYPHRRQFLRGLLTVAGAASASSATAQHQHPAPRLPGPSRARQVPGAIAPRVVTPDVPLLPWKMVGGVKEFHLVAEPVKTEFLPGRTWMPGDSTGTCPGPRSRSTEGDRVRFLVHNNLPEPFSMHWHGLEVPIEMDGGPGISQEPIAPGGMFTYEFTVHQHGTFFYHSHMAMQEMMGMVGFFIVHPRAADTPRVDRDFGLIWQGWALLPNNTIPNTMAMEFNWLTMNGKAGPAATPMIVKVGERVRVRNVNLSMDHHPLHLHGNTFVVTGTEAGRIPPPQWQPGNTVLVGVAQARDFEFVATREGDWMLHCHLPHHMMNQMVSMVGPMTSAHRHGAGAAATPPAPRGMGMPDPTLIPGFPQDMAITMDEAVEKPETFGLRKGWTAGMMGMMTLIRVVSPTLFDQIAERRRALDGRTA